MECSRTSAQVVPRHLRSNNTNKWNAQEPHALMGIIMLDQIIPINGMLKIHVRSNNTNKWNAQERGSC